MNNHLKDIFIAADRNPIGTNRNKEIKAINTLIEQGIKIKVAPKGKIFRLKDNPNKLNIVFSYNGFSSAFYLSDEKMSSYQFIHLASTFLKKEKVKELLSIELSETHSKCTRCNGKGLINAFKHYADGICFKCKGLGITN